MGCDRKGDTIITAKTQISEECFQNIVEFMPRRIKVVLKAKGKSGTRRVSSIK